MSSCAQKGPYFHRVVALFEGGWGHRLEADSRVVFERGFLRFEGMGAQALTYSGGM